MDQSKIPGALILYRGRVWGSKASLPAMLIEAYAYVQRAQKGMSMPGAFAAHMNPKTRDILVRQGVCYPTRLPVSSSAWIRLYVSSHMLFGEIHITLESEIKKMRRGWFRPARRRKP